MLLRTRVALMVLASYLLMAGGLVFFGIKSDEIAEARYSEATLNGQEIFWRKLIENTLQRLNILTPVFSKHPELIDAVAAKDSGLIQQDAVALTDELNGVAKWEIVSPQGELLYSSSSSLQEESLIDAGTIDQIMESSKPSGGIVHDAEGGFTAAIAIPLTKADGSIVAIAAISADLRPPLSEFKEATGADTYLLDRFGKLAQGTDPELWQRVAGQNFEVRKSRFVVVKAKNKYYSVVVLPLHGSDGRVIGALATARDFTANHQSQLTIRRTAAISVGSLFVVVLLWLTIYLRRSFAPLDEAIQVLNALSRGDTSVILEVDNDRDEIGRIAGTVGVFRDNAVKLEQLELRRARQRRRQELFIRLQMRQLSEMLADEAREAVLRDLADIEAMAEQGSGGAAGAERGEIEVLAKAFETMSSRIREQHENLQSLIADRTRDVEILREALRTKDQLAVLRQELDFARELQLSSLPQVFPPFPDRGEFLIHAAMVPAKEVGGDFYDFFLIDPFHLGFVIGDASGKGVPAAMFIAITRTLIKAVAPLSGSPGECLAFVNTMLAVDNPQLLFATVFYAVLDTRTGEVAFSNGGHPPAMILRHGGAIEAIRDVSGVALGVMEGMDYETGTFTLEPGESILLYTDGVTEATDNGQSLFEEYRLINVLEKLHGAHPENIIQKVNAQVDIFVGSAPQFDDITMLALAFVQPTTDDGAVMEPPQRMHLSGFGTTAPSHESLEIESGESEMTPPENIVEQPASSDDLDRVDVNITSDVSELERLAGVVDTFVADHGFPTKIAFNLNLSLDELITNIVSYGYTDGEAHDIQVSLTLQDGYLITRIVDDALEYDPFVEAPEPDLEAGVDERPIGGLGVFLVKELMSRTSYERLGSTNVTTLWQSVTREN